jgi:hypothetical protein
MTDQQDNGVTNRVEVTLEWESLLDIPTIYVNQMFITHGSGKEFYLVFGEVVAPFLLGTPDEVVPKTLPVKPLVRLAIAPETMVDITNAINQNVGKYLSRQQAADTSEDEI